MCLNPSYIVTPFLRNNIKKGYNTIFLLGKPLLQVSQFVTEKQYRLLCYYRHQINEDTLNTCYMVNSHTSEVLPLFFKVPCGKCVICKAFKCNSVVQRCNMETVSYGHTPWFITLTYNDKHNPLHVNKRDIQLFFKRLRKYLDYNNIENNFRYLLVSEYGSKNLRPHYHFILWGFPDVDFKYMRSLIRRAWSVEDTNAYGNRVLLSHTQLIKKTLVRNYYKRSSLGFVKVLPMTSGAPQYIVKYMLKNTIIPEHNTLAPCFMLSSIRNGGIGSSFIDKYVKPILLENPTVTELTFTENVVSQKPFKVYIDQYIKDRVLPSSSKYFTSKLAEVLKSLRLDLPSFQSAMFAVEKHKKDRSYQPSKYKMFANILHTYPVIRKFLQVTDNFFSLSPIAEDASLTWSMAESVSATLYQRIVSNIDTFLSCYDNSDKAYFDMRRCVQDIRQKYFNSLEFEEIDYQERAESIIRRYRRLIDKETC